MAYFAGLDVSVKETSVCIVDDAGKDGSGSEGRNAPEALLIGAEATHLPVRAENLNPGVLVMQPANQDIRHDASDPLNRARDRCILVQRSGMFSRCCSSSRKILGFCANAVRPMR